MTEPTSPESSASPEPPESSAAAEPAAPPSPPSPPRRRRWWQRWKLILAALVATPILAVVLYTAVALNWSYSEGDRAGTLQKFSRKGWVCKTWEGELMQPTAKQDDKAVRK